MLAHRREFLIGESAYLATTLTHVRLLSGVDSLMDSKSRSLNELLSAVGEIANVRADSAVDTFWKSKVSDQVLQILICNIP